MMIMQTLITSCVNIKVTIATARFNGRRFYFGTMMVYKGDADGMVSGAAHTTQHTILPALQFIKLNQTLVLYLLCFYVSMIESLFWRLCY
jgi:phosphotransacetylase